MAKKKIDDVDLLLSKLDKIQLADFIRKECTNDGHLKDRFLALGAGTLFKPDPNTYALRVEDLIEDYGGRHGYIAYRDTFDFNRSVSRILDEALQGPRCGSRRQSPCSAAPPHPGFCSRSGPG